jgi:hypothetical protein
MSFAFYNHWLYESDFSQPMVVTGAWNQDVHAKILPAEVVIRVLQPLVVGI